MKTLEQFLRQPPQIPTATVWLLNDLAEYRGKQELFTRQSPQRLKVLREHALIESAVASNRIEGVEIDQRRVGTVIFGKSHLQDRNEQEVRGYQAALSLIHEQHATLSVSPETILRLHALTRPGDLGQWTLQGRGRRDHRKTPRWPSHRSLPPPLRQGDPRGHRTTLHPLGPGHSGKADPSARYLGRPESRLSVHSPVP